MRVRAKGSVERNLEENPLAIAAGAAVVGLALGLLFPASRRENELMGATRDRLLDTTKDTVRSVKETAKETVKAEASERGDELKQAARGVVDSVKEAAGNVAQETKQAAKETVRSHRNNPRT
jgi:gas vesicle protein